jgi:hypothetical protein
MLTAYTSKLLLSFVAMVLTLTLVGVGIVSTAFARIVANTIDPVATVTDDGRHLIVTGPLACTAGERASLHMTVTQRTTGAVAEGRTLLTCTGDTQHWEVHAATQGHTPFAAGPATAAAMARTTTRGDATDAHQWVVNLTLVEE